MWDAVVLHSYFRLQQDLRGKTSFHYCTEHTDNGQVDETAKSSESKLVFAVIFGTEISTVSGLRCNLQAYGRHDEKPGSLVKLHDDECQSSHTGSWCTASASAWSTNDTLANLTMRHHKGNVCFEIRHNQTQYSLKVLSRIKIVFEKLEPGKDCTSDFSNLFQISDYYGSDDKFIRLKSLKRGLKPTTRAYLAAKMNTQPPTLVPGKLLLIKKYDHSRRNKFKIIRFLSRTRRS
ncbi:uncharacterized protein [Montipora foliosa]|uniref:uncharacterized protein n=1 Tax=Montipora foliosa TaxID=591990 RepID=UPI0035F1B0D9